jgi:hypothetical protein
MCAKPRWFIPFFTRSDKLQAKIRSVATAAAVTVVAEQRIDQVGERSVFAHAEQESQKEGQSAPFQQVGKIKIFVRQDECEDQDPKSSVARTARCTVHYVKPPHTQGKSFFSF